MKNFQRCNHFPGTYNLARKNQLGMNIEKMKKISAEREKDYAFNPKTWCLPADYRDLRNHFAKTSDEDEDGKGVRTFIAKPEGNCQGRGIFLFRDMDAIGAHDQMVVQKYIHNPFLINGLKFDLRIYVLLVGVEPLRIYVHQEGLVRFATEPYQKPAEDNIDNLFMHLTNYAINKKSKAFVQNDDEEGGKGDGHKWSLDALWKYFEKEYISSEELWSEIKDLITKTIISVKPKLVQHYVTGQSEDTENSIAFEILGFDVMIDEELNPYLIEVNHAPSFATDSPLDQRIKEGLIKDTFNILGLSKKRKQNYIKEHNMITQARILTGKKVRLTPEEKDEIRKKKNEDRHKREMPVKGHFDLAYPLCDENGSILGKWGIELEETGINEHPEVALYQELEDVADKEYQSFTTGGTFRNNILTLAEFKAKTTQRKMVSSLATSQKIYGRKSRPIRSATTNKSESEQATTTEPDSKEASAEKGAPRIGASIYNFLQKPKINVPP